MSYFTFHHRNDLYISPYRSFFVCLSLYSLPSLYAYLVDYFSPSIAVSFYISIPFRPSLSPSLNFPMLYKFLDQVRSHLLFRCCYFNISQNYSCHSKSCILSINCPISCSESSILNSLIIMNQLHNEISTVI